MLWGNLTPAPLPATYTKGKTLLSMENISLTLGDNLILRNITKDIHEIIRPNGQGRILGILGPSGVGKTKLFQIISGLLSPTTGTVKVGVEQGAVKPGMVGVVQQHYTLFRHRTVQSNLMLAAKLCEHCGSETCSHHDKPAEQRVAEMLEIMQLTLHKDKYPAELSGGQRQRIAIAQQLLCSEDFLLLDEPFSGLDPNMTKEVSNLLATIANKRAYSTIIIVSHDLRATAGISDTLWVMGRDRNQDGSIVPGAYLKHIYDLMEMNLAWRPNIQHDPQFISLIQELEDKFPQL